MRCHASERTRRLTAVATRRTSANRPRAPEFTVTPLVGYHHGGVTSRCCCISNWSPPSPASSPDPCRPTDRWPISVALYDGIAIGRHRCAWRSHQSHCRVRKTAVGQNGCDARLLMLLLLRVLPTRQRQYVVAAVLARHIAALVHVNVDCRSIFSCSYCHVGRLLT